MQNQVKQDQLKLPEPLSDVEGMSLSELIWALSYRVPPDEDYLDDVAAAFGQVVDSKSPFTSDHSARVGCST